MSSFWRTFLIQTDFTDFQISFCRRLITIHDKSLLFTHSFFTVLILRGLYSAYTKLSRISFFAVSLPLNMMLIRAHIFSLSRGFLLCHLIIGGSKLFCCSFDVCAQLISSIGHSRASVQHKLCLALVQRQSNAYQRFHTSNQFLLYTYYIIHFTGSFVSVSIPYQIIFEQNDTLSVAFLVIFYINLFLVFLIPPVLFNARLIQKVRCNKHEFKFFNFNLSHLYSFFSSQIDTFKKFTLRFLVCTIRYSKFNCSTCSPATSTIIIFTISDGFIRTPICS